MVRLLRWYGYAIQRLSLHITLFIGGKKDNESDDNRKGNFEIIIQVVKWVWWMEAMDTGFSTIGYIFCL